MRAIRSYFRTIWEDRKVASERRVLQRRLVKPDPLSRPYLSINAHRVRIPDSVFRLALFLVWVGAIALVAVEAIHRGGTSLLYHDSTGAALILGAALICLVLLFFDVASYRPRLFALADRDGLRLMREFAAQSGDFSAIFKELRETPPADWAQIPGRQQLFLSAIGQFVEVGHIRARIATYVLSRLGALLGALGLTAYALSTLTSGNVMHGAANRAGLAEHLYFVVTQAITIGFGDIRPDHNLWGYAILMLSVLIMAGVVYFVLAEVVAMQAQFRVDLRAMVERYVVSTMEN